MRSGVPASDCARPGLDDLRFAARPLVRRRPLLRLQRGLSRRSRRCAVPPGPRTLSRTPPRCMPVEKLPAHRGRLRVARRRLDAIVPRDCGGELPHRRRRWPLRRRVQRLLRADAHSPHTRPRELADDARCGVAHRVDGAPHRLLARHHVVEQPFELRRHARIHQCRIGPLKHLEQREPLLRRHDVLPLRGQEPLPLQPRDDLAPRRRRADPLRFAQPFAQRLVVDESPCVLHRLDQRAFLVTRRRPGLLVLDHRFLQPRGLSIAQHRQRLAPSPFSSSGRQPGNAARQPASSAWRPVARNSCPPASIVTVVCR